MDPDTEVQRVFTNVHEVEDEDEARKKSMRPPSSYGSMKSDSESMEDEEEEEYEEEEVEEQEEEHETEDTVAELPEPSTNEDTGVQMYRPESPETLYTMTTMQTKPPGAVVIDTGSCDLEDFPEDDDDIEEDEDELLLTNSPEPPEPIEPDDAMQTDENSQPGRLHPEQDMPHIFKSIQSTLTSLSREDLLTFKMTFHQWEKRITLLDTVTGDILDFVDKILEVLGEERALLHTIHTLENINKKEDAVKLEKQCKRVLLRHNLRHALNRKHHVLHEGVALAGRQELIDNVYVEPLIATCSYGGVDPSHEFRPNFPLPVQVPSDVTYIVVNNLFRQQKDDGTPVRKVLTTGIPGIGMSVCVAKFCFEWAEHRANLDIQFVIKISFQAIWNLRKREEKMVSMMDVIEYYHPDLRGMTFLDEESCKYLIIMDAFDRYQVPLDWENAPVINGNHTKAHPDVLIVNILRGNVLPGARVWILGRSAAVSQIPSQFIDLFTELEGFSEEMKDDYLTKRYRNAELAAKIVAHYKRVPTLKIFARQPFVCWMVAKVFELRFRSQDFGANPPRLTGFYINHFVIQANRRLEFYHGRTEHHINWSSEDKQMLTNMAKMAFTMLERNTSVFYEEDLKEHGLQVYDVVVCTGLCSELRTPASTGRRMFCFFHFTFQEFMAALYVFTMFYIESKNILDSGSLMSKIISKYSPKSAAGVVHSAIMRTFQAPLGHYDMFLRFLCGMFNTDSHDELLSGVFYHHRTPKVAGLDEVQRLLEQTIQKAPADRVDNLKECLREMIQKDP